jgi:large subunit ribosomal protein L33
VATRRGLSGNAGRPSRRIPVTLACSVCGGRNYRTSKNVREGDGIELKKFCQHCKQHRMHIEGK